MRIIAGEFSSRRLETRKGNDTRPTLDKVKEAMFSAIGGFFDGGTGLDLYAGSGAVGLEGLSRGLDHVYLSDNSREAVSVIKKNVSLLKVEDRTDVYPVADTKILNILKGKDVHLDFVYLDPPYAKQKNLKVMQFIDENEMMNDRGWLVIESLQEESYQADTFKHLHYVKEAVYGIMKLTYYRYEDEN